MQGILAMRTDHLQGRDISNAIGHISLGTLAHFRFRREVSSLYLTGRGPNILQIR